MLKNLKCITSSVVATTKPNKAEVDGRAEAEIFTKVDDDVLVGIVVILNSAGVEVSVKLNGAGDDELRNEPDVVVVEMESRAGQSYR